LRCVGRGKNTRDFPRTQRMYSPPNPYINTQTVTIDTRAVTAIAMVSLSGRARDEDRNSSHSADIAVKSATPQAA
jgi:hypothetical protein